MKKTLRLLGMMALTVATFAITFTSCKKEDEDENEKPLAPFTYTFEDVASWEIAKSFVFHEFAEGENYLYAAGSKDPSLTFDQIYEMFDEGNFPENMLFFAIPARLGTNSYDGNFLLSEAYESCVLFITGKTQSQFYGETIPTGWVSNRVHASLSEFDLTAMKASVDISANMVDIMSIMGENDKDSSAEKTLTIRLNKATLSDFSSLE